MKNIRAIMKRELYGYFTTPVGMEDLGYVGNRPTDSFAGPPEAALRMAGVKV